MNDLIIIFAILAVGAVGYAIYATMAAEKKYVDGLIEFAARNRMRYSRTSGSDFAKAVFKTNLGSHGRSHRIGNAIEGEFRGKKVCVCELKYKTGSGDSHKDHLQTVVVMRAPTQLPDFQLRPESMRDRIADKDGYQDVTFDDYPTFKSQYVLRGKDEEAVRKAFNKAVISRLETMKCFSVESKDGHLFVWHDDRRQKVVNLENFLMLSLAMTASFAPKSS